MKLSFKRIAAFFAAAVIAVTSLVINVSAKGVFDDAIKMEALEYYSKNFKKNEIIYYKINIPSDGKITLYCEEAIGSGWEKYYLLDSNANEVTKGYNFLTNNHKNEIKDITKGTYYLKIAAGSDDDLYFKNLYYSFTSDEKPTIKLNVSIYEGSSIQLGAIVENSKSSVTWLSTKPKVASVSSNGRVKGLKAGKSTIRASLNSGEYVEIRVTVVEKE